MISEMMINKQLESAKEGSLEYGVGMVLIEICKANPLADELVAQDLTIEAMSLKKCGEKLYEYAKKNKSGNCYGMIPQIADKLIKEFYGIHDKTTAAQPVTAPNNVISIEDLLGDI